MLDLIIKNGSCFIDGKLQKKEIGVKYGKIKQIDAQINTDAKENINAES